MYPWDSRELYFSSCEEVTGIERYSVIGVSTTIP
ncbi:MAG: hypothetical protein HW407_2035, partial [Bacteroidetes bacterium]|nr:hypothetical protein [Bacteroidota bacterium]